MRLPSFASRQEWLGDVCELRARAETVSGLPARARARFRRFGTPWLTPNVRSEYQNRIRLPGWRGGASVPDTISKATFAQSAVVLRALAQAD